ncbi:MAG: hypothetical protein ACUVWN_11905 [bacterium]
MATYPNRPNLPGVSSETYVDSVWGNSVIDNINAIGDDLVNTFGDEQNFPGIEHSPGQIQSISGAIQAIRHMLVHIIGKTNWYEEPNGSLRAHNHSEEQGGLIPWSSIGASNYRSVVLSPKYFGALQTNSLRGGTASGNNIITLTTGVELVSSVGKYYYEGISDQTNLNDTYIALLYDLPVDFNSWSENAIQIEYKTGSALSSYNHIDVYIYKSGTSNVIASSENNVNTSWSTINIGSSSLGNWSAGDALELYIKFESKSNNYVRVGKITFGYNV